MKRILTLFLCFTMVFTITACSNNTNDTTNPQTTPSGFESAPDNTDPNVPSDDITSDDTVPTTTVSNDTVPDDTIRENGKLPDDIDDLTNAEINHYIGIVMQAIIDLDVETMDEYTTDNNTAAIRLIKKNDAYRTVWEKTVGQSIYLEDSHILVYKDPEYVFANWITDSYKKGSKLKSNIAAYSLDEMQTILDSYSTDTPYVADELDIDDIDIDLEDGKIIIDCNSILEETTWDELSNMCTPSYDYDDCNEQMAHIIFGEHCEISLGMDYIRDDGAFTIWEPMIGGDFAKIIAAFDAATGYDLNAEITDTTNMLWEIVYQTYYKDPTTASTVQAWMKSNVKILRNMSSVIVYIPAETERTYPYYTLTDAEKAELTNISIYVKEQVHKHQANTQNEFNPFYVIIEQMLYLGEIERLH